MTKTPQAEASGPLSSMKTSYANAILELQHCAEERRLAGDQLGCIALLEKSNELSIAALGIRKAEMAASQATSLTPTLKQLSKIAIEARKEVEALKKAADKLAQAAKIVAVLSKLLEFFP